MPTVNGYERFSSKTLLYIWVTRGCYKKDELLTHREHLSSPPVFWWGLCCLSLILCCPVMCFYVRSEFSVVMSATISAYKWYSIRPCLQLFLTGYFWVCFVHSGVQHILWCVLFFFVLCTLCCQFLWIVHFWLPLQRSLKFILYQ